MSINIANMPQTENPMADEIIPFPPETGSTWVDQLETIYETMDFDFSTLNDPFFGSIVYNYTQKPYSEYI